MAGPGPVDPANFEMDGWDGHRHRLPITSRPQEAASAPRSPLRLIGPGRATVAARAGRQQGAAMLALGAQQKLAHASNSG